MYLYDVELTCNGMSIDTATKLTIDEAMNYADGLADVLEDTGAQVYIRGFAGGRFVDFAKHGRDGEFSMLYEDIFAEFKEAAPMNSTKYVCQMPHAIQKAVSDGYSLGASDSRFCSICNDWGDYINIARAWLDNK